MDRYNNKSGNIDHHKELMIFIYVRVPVLFTSVYKVIS